MELIKKTTICVIKQVSGKEGQYANELITKKRMDETSFPCTYGESM